MDEVGVKEYLIKTDQGFRKLAEQHQQYERQLERCLQRSYTNESDQIQETIIKKKKLALKDQMQMLIYRYQSEHSIT